MIPENFSHQICCLRRRGSFQSHFTDPVASRWCNIVHIQAHPCGKGVRWLVHVLRIRQFILHHAYVETHEETKNINWQEFKAVFRSHHVPIGSN
jgi:hypothetical protein